MGVITRTEERLWASCHDSLCEGYQQERVDGIRETLTHVYVGNEGRMAAGQVESTTDRFLAAQAADAVCPHCGGPRIIDPQQRPWYEPLSGMDPLHLAKQLRGIPTPEMRIQSEQVEALREGNRLQREHLERDEEVTRLRADLTEMRALLARSRPDPDPVDAEVVPPRKTRQRA